MATEVYGASDDCVCFDGDFGGEVSSYGTDDREQGIFVVMSDGTLLEAKYGKGGRGVWGMEVLRKGSLLDRVEQCFNDASERNSDVVYFRDGIEWAYAATGEWELVR